MLREYAARAPEGKPKRLVLRFLASPVAIHGDDRVEAVEVVRNRLEADAAAGSPRCRPTSARRSRAGLVLRSVGYRGVAIPGVPFDEGRGTIRNDGGRVLDERGEQVPGVYATGWIKRGPSGVIGTNKKDATETVELLLEDLESGRLRPAGHTADEVDALLDERGVDRVALRRLDGDRRARARPRRGAGPSARQALHLGRAARRGQCCQ